MREIKFRAWDTSRKEWSQRSFAIDQQGGLHMWRQIYDNRPNYAYGHTDLHPIIQMFTGLTDKNGTEIYEGDILDGYCSQGRVKLGAIEWQQNKLRFYAPPRKANNDHDLFERMGSYEVIGNIWENGDLLT